MSPDEFIAELWDHARALPMGEHPWFQGILRHRWTRRQIILGEVQHYLRVRTNPIFFGYIAVNAVADKQYDFRDRELTSTSCSSFSKKAAFHARRRTVPSPPPARWRPLK
jgi:hypothetical protein